MKNVPKPGKSLITRRSVVRIGSPLPNKDFRDEVFFYSFLQSGGQSFTLLRGHGRIPIKGYHVGSPLLRRNQSTQYSGFLFVAGTVVADILESENLKKTAVRRAQKPRKLQFIL